MYRRVGLLLLFGSTAVMLVSAQRRMELDELESYFVAPDVVASSSVTAGSPGHGTLRVLVLWRGTIGWAQRGYSQHITGTAAPITPEAPFPRWMSQKMIVGNGTLDVRLDFQALLVEIDHQPPFDLRRANVFLVDSIDEASGRPIRALWVDPDVPADAALPASKVVSAIIRREPDLRAFLRCDAVDSDKGPIRQLLCDATLKG
jgi:hypothetical protein